MSKWNIEAETGYHPITTFWDDFSIADKFGIDAVQETFDRAFAEWKNNHMYLTELSMVLNHKAWQLYLDHKGLAELYCLLFEQVDAYALDNLKGSELRYYLSITD